MKGSSVGHTLKFNIEVEVGFHDNQEALKIQHKFIKALIADKPERISFEELDEILYFGGRQYYVKKVDYSEINRDIDDSITKFEITG